MKAGQLNRMSPTVDPRRKGRFTVAALVILLAAAALSLVAGSEAFAQRHRPNFLIIVTDDQRADTFTEEFMPKTLAMLVNQGVSFERGYVTTPLCCPSRSSILTGMYARNHGVLRNPDPLLQTTFVERLHEAGYHTGLVGKYLNSWDGSARPEFDSWVAHAGGGSRYFDPRLNVNGEWSVHPGYITYILRDYALDFLRGAPSDRPFAFLWTPNAPHAAADPAPGDEELYPDLPLHRPPSFNEADVSDKPAWVQARRSLTAAQIAAIDTFRRKQLQTLKPVDDAIGQMLTLLEEQGRLDDTLVVFLADNGYFWGEHRINQGKNRVYEESQKVPFALRYPRLVRGPRVESRLVANIDIAPTIYQLAGLPIPAEVDGFSLVPLMRGTRHWREDLLLESWPAQPYAAIHTERYVYVETEADSPELYDLELDPYQLENVVDDPDYAKVVEELRGRLTVQRPAS